jgi:transcriptional regulator with XRE-family HTH domain
MDLKERLAQLRSSYGYSLRELRERIERETGDVMAISYLSALERVERTPSIDTLSRIAAGYGMTLQELLGPVGIASEPEAPRYSPSFDAFARNRNLDASDREDLWRIQYRGARPETEDDWDLLYLTLNKIGRGRRR